MTADDRTLDYGGCLSRHHDMNVALLATPFVLMVVVLDLLITKLLFVVLVPVLLR